MVCLKSGRKILIELTLERTRVLHWPQVDALNMKLPQSVSRVPRICDVLEDNRGTCAPPFPHSEAHNGAFCIHLV